MPLTLTLPTSEVIEAGAAVPPLADREAIKAAEQAQREDAILSQMAWNIAKAEHSEIGLIPRPEATTGDDGRLRLAVIHDIFSPANIARNNGLRRNWIDQLAAEISPRAHRSFWSVPSAAVLDLAAKSASQALLLLCLAVRWGKTDYQIIKRMRGKAASDIRKGYRLYGTAAQHITAAKHSPKLTSQHIAEMCHHPQVPLTKIRRQKSVAALHSLASKHHISIATASAGGGRGTESVFQVVRPYNATWIRDPRDDITPCYTPDDYAAAATAITEMAAAQQKASDVVSDGDADVIEQGRQLRLL